MSQRDVIFRWATAYALVVLTLAWPLSASVPAGQSAALPIAPPALKAQQELRRQQGEAYYQEGLRWVVGDGVQDYGNAAALYRKAAELGYAPAQYELASLYEQGLGVECDPEQAARWYRRAAEQGHVEAQNDLGTLYATGKGVPHNDSEAMRWYTLAAAQGDAEATSNLGAFYLRGRGVTEDPAKAFELFARSAEQGYGPAQNNLGLMYANGKGTARDYIRAWAWLDVAATQMRAASGIRDQVAAEMTAEELGRACDLAMEIRQRLAGKEEQEQ